ncbi:hypothetical protein LTR51_005590 [Lithohypha guttulata]|nr:hypothetical protein LTR51_005590 [Lithohypha guttulata]
MPTDKQNLSYRRIIALHEAHGKVPRKELRPEVTPAGRIQPLSTSDSAEYDVEPFEEVRFLSCGSRLFLEASDEGAYTQNDAEHEPSMKDYLDLELLLTQIFGSAAQEITCPYKDCFILGIPAAHIAFWNHHEDLAITLWQRSKGHFDMLGIPR